MICSLYLNKSEVNFSEDVLYVITPKQAGGHAYMPTVFLSVGVRHPNGCVSANVPEGCSINFHYFTICPVQANSPSRPLFLYRGQPFSVVFIFSYFCKCTFFLSLLIIIPPFLYKKNTAPILPLDDQSVFSHSFNPSSSTPFTA